MLQRLLIFATTLVLLFTTACGPQGEGASTFRLSALDRAEIEKVVEANIITKVEATAEAKIADKIDKVEAKVEARIADTIDNRVTQTVRDFQGKQNIGMFAGDSVYILILAIVVVAAVFLFFIYVLRNKAAQQSLVLSAVTSGVSRAKRTGMGNGEEAGVNKVLAEIKKHAEKAGVEKVLDRMLVENGLL